jgi:hypothetical protein
MEASEGVIRAHVDSLMKLMAALDAAGVELINDGALSQRGRRGVVEDVMTTPMPVRSVRCCIVRPLRSAGRRRNTACRSR